MVLPRLIHPIQITIERLDFAESIIDPDTREPIGAAARMVSATVPGQLLWSDKQDLRMLSQGRTGDDRGYALFRKVDLDAAGFELKINDRLVAQGHLLYETYVIRLQPMGHYPDQNGYSLIRAWFEERLPAKERA